MKKKIHMVINDRIKTALDSEGYSIRDVYSAKENPDLKFLDLVMSVENEHASTKKNKVIKSKKTNVIWNVLIGICTCVIFLSLLVLLFTQLFI